MELNTFLAGAIAACSLVVALFFLRFWRASRDRFFLYFALAFTLEAANRSWMALRPETVEDSPAAYLPRLLAYSLILWAIFEKNRPPPQG